MSKKSADRLEKLLRKSNERARLNKHRAKKVKKARMKA